MNENKKKHGFRIGKNKTERRTACCLLLFLSAVFLTAFPTAAEEGNPEFFKDVATVSETTGSKALKVVLDTSEDTAVSLTAPGTNAVQGELIGYFTTTGFCTCELCTGGRSQGLTASGTKPKARHTIAADTSRFPFGTRLMINGIVYTVEDEGTGIKGDWIDIYYDNHAEAVAHGTKYGQAVYTAAE